MPQERSEGRLPRVQIERCAPQRRYSHFMMQGEFFDRKTYVLPHALTGQSSARYMPDV